MSRHVPASERLGRLLGALILVLGTALLVSACGVLIVLMWRAVL